MIFAIRHVQFEALEVDTSAKRQPRSVTTLVLSVGNFHFVSTSEVISSAHPYVLRQRDIHTECEVVYEVVVPVIEVDERRRQAKRRVCDMLADAYLHVDGHAFVRVVVCLELSAEILCHNGERQFAVGVVVVESEIYAHADGVVAADI